MLTPPACQVIIPTTCTAFGQYNEEVNLEPSGQGAGPDQGLFVGNGYCGSFDSIFTAGAGGWYSWAWSRLDLVFSELPKPREQLWINIILLINH